MINIMPESYIPRELMAYGENIYSQAGEDGILAEVFRRLGIVKGRYVDIGAHDGRFMSNTERLRECGWEGLSADNDPRRTKDLERCVARFPGRQESLCLTVTPQNVEGLADWPNVDFLDIDVDGPELQIWKAIPDNGPTVTLMEIDPLDPLGTLREHSAAKRLSSFSSMVALAESKGYRLVAYTGLNCLFIQAGRVADVLSPAPDSDRLYMDGTARLHYRTFVKIRSDARAQLRCWSNDYR